jgi:hypothetical protein
MKKKKVKIYKTVTVYNARLLKDLPNTAYIGVSSNLEEIIVCLEKGYMYITVNGYRVMKRYVYGNGIYNICNKNTLSIFAKKQGINLVFKDVEMKTYDGEKLVKIKEVKFWHNSSWI